MELKVVFFKTSRYPTNRIKWVSNGDFKQQIDMQKIFSLI